MKQMQHFHEWLEERDSQLYQEITAGDIWRGAKGAWNKTGKLIGNKTRNFAAAGAIGAIGLGAFTGGGSQDPSTLAKQLNMDVQTVQYLQQNSPKTIDDLLNMPSDERIKQSQKVVDQLGRKTNYIQRTGKAAPEEGNWDVPDSHYQSPNFQGGPSPKLKTNQDVVRDIDDVLQRK